MLFRQSAKEYQDDEYRTRHAHVPLSDAFDVVTAYNRGNRIQGYEAMLIYDSGKSVNILLYGQPASGLEQALGSLLQITATAISNRFSAVAPKLEVKWINGRAVVEGLDEMS